MAKRKAKSSDLQIMSWKKLLSDERLKPLELTASGARSPFVIDQDIIINSQPFRRLQDKTQVHPLSDNDHVRRRLTHSVEVASIGRALGKYAAELLLRNHPELHAEGVSQETFGDILYAACLAHDIGNPPFGHFGETAIQTALTKMIDRPKSKCEALSDQERADLAGWEGNAHGFRVLNTLEKYQDDGGMRLTAATLAAFTKYPWSSVSERGKVKGKEKFGYFQSEENAFSHVARHVGLLADPSGGWCRHPLAHLVEAADDIAYAVGDLEDGCELKLVSFDEIETLFKDIIRRPEVRDRRRSERRRFEFLREEVVQNAVADVAETFVNQHSALIAGRLPKGILPISRVGKIIEDAKKLATERIFQASQKAGVEVASFDVIGTLIKKIVTALLTIKHGGSGSREHRRLIEFTLNKKAEWITARSDFELLLSTADYIAGMTDSYAIKTYRHITGIDFSAGR